MGVVANACAGLAARWKVIFFLKGVAPESGFHQVVIQGASQQADGARIFAFLWNPLSGATPFRKKRKQCKSAIPGGTVVVVAAWRGSEQWRGQQ